MTHYSPIKTRSGRVLECKNCKNYLMKIGSLEDKVVNLEHCNANLSVDLHKLNADFDTFQDLREIYRRLYENSNDENKRLYSKNNVLIILLVVVCVFLIGLVVNQQKKM